MAFAASEGQTESSTHQIAQALQAWSGAEQEPLEKLTGLVYEELHRAAHRYMARERLGHTPQTTALVNELCLRLVDAREVAWQDRAHSFAVCARLTRRVLTDSARSRGYLKRGGGSPHAALDEALVVSPEPRGDLVAQDEALNALAAIDPPKSQVVELRFFGGLSVEETAEVLKASMETVKRDWGLARVWSLRDMRGERGDGR